MKKILLGAFLLLTVFLIYLGTIDKKVYYLSLGDSLAAGLTPYGTTDYGYANQVSDYLQEKGLLETYVSEFSKVGYRTTDLLRDIEVNKKITIGKKQKTIKNALIKADLVTLSIGTNDILSKLETYKSFSTQEIYDHMDESLSDLETLFSKIREYCKEDIVLVGYYNYFKQDSLDTVIRYFNKRAEQISRQYNIIYINIYDDFQNKDYLDNPKDIHPSKEGYQLIGDKIIQSLESTLLKR